MRSPSSDRAPGHTSAPKGAPRPGHVAVLRLIMARAPSSAGRRGKGQLAGLFRWPWPGPMRVRPAQPGTVHQVAPVYSSPHGLCTSTTAERRPMLVPSCPQRYVADRARRELHVRDSSPAGCLPAADSAARWPASTSGRSVGHVLTQDTVSVAELVRQLFPADHRSCSHNNPSNVHRRSNRPRFPPRYGRLATST